MEDWTKQAIIVWIWIVIAILSLFATLIVFLIKRHLKVIKVTEESSVQTILETKKEFTKKVTRYQELDRQRLSEELHDNVVSRLNLLHLNLFEGNITSLKRNLKKSMQVVRELSHNLTPVELNVVALSDLIEDYLEQITNIITIQYYKYTLKNHTTTSNIIKLNLFRIFQELITNTLKHAEATELKIVLRSSAKSVVLIVEDNGRGLITDSHKKGIGHKNIEIRAGHINGTYKFKTRSGYYTRFIICVPQIKNISKNEY